MNKLRQEWMMWTALGAGLLAAGYALLASQWAPVYAARWLPLPALGLGYLLWVAFNNLSANHRHGETAILPSLGWGNRLTLLRGIFVAGMLGFVVLPHPLGWLSWIPGILYTLADAADFFDGYVARVTNHTTPLGEILDLSFDGVGVLVATVLAVEYGKVPAWYLGIGLARYLFVAGIWVRRKLNKPVYELPPLLSRRVFAGLQMGFLAGVLWPVFTPPGTHIAAFLFGMPLFVGFIRDWLYVSGVLKPQQVSSGISKLASRWLPVALRIALVALNVAGILEWLQNWSNLPAALAGLGLLNLTAVLLLALGIAPRIAAIGALCALGFYQLFSPLTPGQITLAVIYTFILYVGGGALSVWTPEEYLWAHHAGENHQAGSRRAGMGNRA